MEDNAAILLSPWICAAWGPACKLWYLGYFPVSFPFWWQGSHWGLSKGKRSLMSGQKSGGARWNPTTQTPLNASDSPGRRGRNTCTSIHGLRARLDTHLSKTWCLFKPRWISRDTGEWSKGEYALCHQTIGWYLMATFRIDQEQISSTLRSWESAFFSFLFFFSRYYFLSLVVFVPSPAFLFLMQVFVFS